MNKKNILFFFFAVLCSVLYAQTRDPKKDGSISIHRDNTYMNMTVEELLKSVFLKPGNCTQIKNVKARMLGWNDQTKKWNTSSSWKGKRGLAYFTRADSDFPIEKGLIMSTTNVTRIEGPNEVSLGLGNANEDVQDLIGDPDLQRLVGNEVGRNIYDVCVIEFDFVAASSSVVFNYIFASEEFPFSANHQFNDAFAFFIHNKNNPNDKTNIAMLPETLTGNYVVSINNVNDGAWKDFTWQEPITQNNRNQSKNPRFFVRQPEGTRATEFNGYIYDRQNKKTLQAIFSNLIICDEYHIKLVVGNMQDQANGSGVFFEAHSFTMDPQLEIISNNMSVVDYLYRKCDSKIRVKLLTSESSDWNAKLVYSGLINGTDIMQLDGSPLPQNVIIPAGDTYIDIPFKLREDIADNSAFGIKMEMNCICNSSNIVENSISVNIKNNYPVFDVTKTLPCTTGGKGTITVNTRQGNSQGYQYSKDGGISWQNENVFNNLPIGTYFVKIRHSQACDESAQAAKIEIIPLTADAGPDLSQCNPVFVMDANNPGSNETGRWSVISPLDGILIGNPTLYNTSVTMDLNKTNTATLRWTIDNGSCSVSDDIIINYNSCSFPVNPHLRSGFR